MASWNVLATSLEGRRDALLMALRRLGKFRRGGYRNVVVGTVESVDEFLARVHEALDADPLLPTALARVVPIEATVRFEAPPSPGSRGGGGAAPGAPLRRHARPVRDAPPGRRTEAERAAPPPPRAPAASPAPQPSTFVDPSRLPPSRACPTRGSPITLITDGFPAAKARSSAGRISSGRVTCSPWQPIASNMRS